ncbi:MAG: DUF1902 domain-containing protein [Kiloniellales bacterium]
MTDRIHKVIAKWDDEAKVWVAFSDDVPGLATEAENLDALVAKLKVMVPEMLEENAAEPPPFDGYRFSIELPMVAERLQGAA